MNKTKKIFAYSYNKATKEFEKFSIENDLFHPKDVCRKQRIAIIKDTLEFIKMFSGKDYKGNKIEYLPMILMPSKLFIVVGSGLSVSMLNGLNKQELKEWENIAIKVKIDNKVAFGYTNIKDQVIRWGMRKNEILVLDKKQEVAQKKVPKIDKCLFSQGGYCVCWEEDGSGKCDGVHKPKGCPK